MRLWRRTLQILMMVNPLFTMGLWADGSARAQAIGGIRAIFQGRAAVAPARNAAQEKSDNELAENVFLPPDRALLQELSQAGELLKQQRYGEAVRHLGAILDAPEDYFFQPDKDLPLHRSLKAEARQLIGQMPRQGRDLYELQYGAHARKLLGDAVSAGDRAGLAEISRRFFHTQAGYEATLLLGMDHLDRNRPLAGALVLERLRRAPDLPAAFEPTLSLALAACWHQAGLPDRARETATGLKKRLQGAKVVVAGKELPWFDTDAEVSAWLAGIAGVPRVGGPAEEDRWLVFRGNAARNASMRGGSPLLNMRWQVPVTDDPMTEELLQECRRHDREQGLPTLPGLHPLVVRDVVLMRTVRNLLAVDFVTGKRLWEIPVDDVTEGSSGANSGATDAFGRQVPQAALALGYRMWDDAVFGTFSSDGQLVFTIEDLDVGISSNQTAVRRVIINGRAQMTSPQPSNRLAAHDIRTGKLKWHLGGAADSFALRQAGTYFLGAPLPLMGQLYVLAEIKEEIRLLALDATTGDLLWSQQLAVVERNIQSDPLRRLAGASPSYADGVLICPTSNGAVVAVDLATRSLLWGYRYERPRQMASPFVGIAIQAGSQGAQQVQRWDDGTATVVNGCVLISPVESDSLHCLSLMDGRLLWKYKRQDDLYVACVHQGQVILVGAHQVRALSLTQTTDGTETVEYLERTSGGTKVTKTERPVKVPRPGWDGRVVELPEGSMPSGRGFLADDRYFVPLSSADVMAVDLVGGKVSHVSKSRKGTVPGNLVCYKGRVISQGFDGVELFYQLDAVREEVDRRLAAKADDAEALSLRGEILLDEGNRAEAIASFRRAYQLDGDARTRALLRDALLDGLRLDFAAHRARAEEIEQLLDDSLQRATYLRLMATGLRAMGDASAALECYLKLIDLDQEQRGLETVSQSLAVRRDRWIQAQLSSLREEAGSQTSAIDRLIDERLEAALAATPIDPLRRFLDYFGTHPAAGRARRELFRRLADAGRLLEAEMVLWPEQQSADRATAGAAVAALAELLRQANRLQDAAVYYHRLRDEFADVVCRDGKTGKQCFDALPADAPVRRLLTNEARWPAGNVEAKAQASRRAQQSYYANYAVPLPDGARPFFSDITLRFDQSRMQIHGCDALGNERWQVGLIEPGTQQNFPFNPMAITGRVCGHLLLVSMGHRIAAIDGLGASESGKPKLLWSQSILNASLESAKLRRLPNQVLNVPWGWQQWQTMQYYQSNNLSAVGPVGSRYVCFQRYRSILAADPLTGDLLWVRHEIPQGSVLFGDSELVLVVPPGQAEALVFRALDGEMLGKRKVPRHEPGPAGAVATVVAGNLNPFGIRANDSAARNTYNHACIAILGRQVLTWQPEGNERVLELFDPWQQRSQWRSRKFTRDACTALVGQEAIGVLERNGRFALLALPDGRTIADVQLEPEEQLAEIMLLRTGDQYILVANSSPRNPAATRRFTQPLPGASDRAIYSGRVYSLDLQGKLLWAQPTKIEQQHLMVNQPGRLPILTFACQVWDQTKQGVSRQRVSVLCLDKRTGRKVYRGDFPSVASTFEIVGDPQKSTIDLRLYQQTVTLRFTEDPIQPIAEAEAPPDEQDEPEKLPGSPQAQGVRALWKVLEKAMSTPAGKTPGAKPANPQEKPAAAKPAVGEKPADVQQPKAVEAGG